MLWTQLVRGTQVGKDMIPVLEEHEQEVQGARLMQRQLGAHRIS